uniref:CCHC-type domain-containing protein n=1 Tax=Panagrolaimus superbus TaxID=310955 RepID=A0A914ZCZ3_9BILA
MEAKKKLEDLERDLRALSRSFETLQAQHLGMKKEYNDLIVALAQKVKKEQTTMKQELEDIVKQVAQHGQVQTTEFKNEFTSALETLFEKMEKHEGRISTVMEQIKSYIDTKTAENFLHIKKLEERMSISNERKFIFEKQRTPFQAQPAFLTSMLSSEGRKDQLESLRDKLSQPSQSMTKLELLLQESSLEPKEEIKLSTTEPTIQVEVAKDSTATSVDATVRYFEVTPVIDVNCFYMEGEMEQFTGDPTKPFFVWETQLLLFLATKEIPPTPQQSLAHLVRLLSGTAIIYYRSLPGATSNNFQATLDALRDHFPGRQAKQVADQQLMHAKQRQGESVHDFSTRLLRLVEASMMSEPPNIVNHMLKHYLIVNLLPELRLQVQRTPLANYEEALAKAYEAEAFQQMKNDLQINMQTLRIEASPADRELICYWCHERGHIKRRCPQLRERQSSRHTSRPFEDSRGRNDRYYQHRNKSGERYDNRGNQDSYHRAQYDRRGNQDSYHRAQYDRRGNQDSYHRAQSPNYQRDYSRNNSRDHHRSSTPYYQREGGYRNSRNNSNERHHSTERSSYNSQQSSRNHSRDRYESQHRQPDRESRHTSQERRKPVIRFADNRPKDAESHFLQAEMFM